MIFADELPRDERSTAFFIDRHGNPYISQYGSICEKHVPKYRSEKKMSQSKTISERYYSVLKGCSLEKGARLAAKRNCDSHCICQQSLIPVPYDIVTTGTTQQCVSNDQQMVDEVTAINETINNDPHNIVAWLSLITVQSKANQMGVASSLAHSNVVEKRLMIVERALTKNQGNMQLHLLRMRLGGELWTIDKIQKEWNQLLFVCNTNIDVWRFYIDQIARKSLGFSVEKVIAVYSKCFATFFNVMSGRMKTKTIDAATVMALCDLFADYCDYLTQSGYTERAIASWQIIIEYNILCGNVAPKQSGNILDDPMLQSLHHYWTSCTQHIGQPESRGWSNVIIPHGPCPIQACLSQFVTDTESDLIATDLNEPQMWLYLENARHSAWWLPYCNNDIEQEDPDRNVSFSMLQTCLITLHGPCNLTADHCAAIVSNQAKKRLLILFFDHIGVFHPRVSIKHSISSGTIRSQQIKLCDNLTQYISPLTQRRQSLANFVHGSFIQLRDVIDTDWTEDISLLELSYTIHSHLATDNWKEALSGIKQSAKQILSTNTCTTALWIAYADLLLTLTNQRLFHNTDRALKTLLTETNKVIQALSQQISSPSTMSLDHQLSILSLSINLVTHQHPDHCRHVIPFLYQATCLLSQHYSLNLPQNTLSSLCLIQTEIMSLIVTGKSHITHWHFTLYYQSLSRLLLAEIEPFFDWLSYECLQTVTNLGSKCNWSASFLYQLSHFLEMLASFFVCYLRCRDLNEGAFLRTLLGPFVKSLTQVQSEYKTPILDLVFSPKLVQLCIAGRSLSIGQKLSVRNFLWNVVGCSETETITTFNYVSHGSSLLLLDMELQRWLCLKTESESELFSGRADRVRSTFNRLLSLTCMHWRYRLALWLSMMQFEKNELSAKNEERTKAVFYRAVTEMPGQKCLYVAAVSLVPSLIDEVTTLMKNNSIRLCAPIEEIKLLLRIRDSTRPKFNEDTK